MKTVYLNKWHIQFRGKFTVEYYPARKMAYIEGMYKPFKCSKKLARKLSDDLELLPLDRIEKVKRVKNNIKSIRHNLYYRSLEQWCFVCGKIMAFEDTSLEHKIPISKGGSNSYVNLTLSHKWCNKMRGDMI